jgi:hypothetical protein
MVRWASHGLIYWWDVEHCYLRYWEVGDYGWRYSLIPASPTRDKWNSRQHYALHKSADTQWPLYLGGF